MPLDDDTRNAIIQKNAAAHRQYERIRRNPNLSHAGVQRAMAKVRVQTENEVAQMKQAGHDATAARISHLQSVAFGIHAQSNDPSAAISLRDALDRVAQVDSPAAAQQLLNRAVVTGDETLARAIALHAYTSMGDRDLGDHWAGIYSHYRDGQTPARQRILDELDTIRQADSPQARFRDSVACSVPTPPELVGAGNIDYLASQADTPDQGGM